MRTGRLSISRGHRHETADGTPAAHLSLVAPVAAPAPPVAADLDNINARLSALERLVRLYEQGALSIDEFAAEKMLILGDLPRAAPVHFVPAVPRRTKPRPSLLGRMLSWPFLLLCLAAGIGLSFAAQPAATTRFATQLWHSVAG